MAFQKGNKFASHDKPWTNALQRVLAQLEAKDKDGKVIVQAGEALRAIAERTVELALLGDKDARKEIADRLDGKPSEFVNVNATRDPAQMSTDELVAEIKRNRAVGNGTGQEDGRSESPSSVH
jgi:formylmethanofuran dehydrogenase subunit A